MAADENFMRIRCNLSHRAALKASASALLIVLASSAAAQDSQTAAQPQPAPQPLPPVVVQSSPKPAQQTVAKPKRKSKSTQRTVANQAPAAAPSAPTNPTGPIAAPETATSPVKGIVAKVSGTATKTDTPIAETPQSISVVTRDQMNQQGAQSVPQALQYTSGVAADTRTAFTGFDIVYSRGFILDRFLDGLKYPTGSVSTAAQLELYGLERLEVLHGPASMLYGASSPGGIINAVSKRPLDEPYHEVEFTFGNFDHVEAAFDFSGPLTSDKTWSYRLSGLARDFDSQVDFNQQERYWLAPALTWKPAAGTSITFLGNIQHDPEAGLYSQLPIYGLPAGAERLPRSLYLGEPDYNVNRRDQQSVGYALESHIDDMWTVRQNLRFMHVDGAIDQFLPLPPDFGGGVYEDSGQFFLPRYVLTSWSDQNSFSIDTNAEAKFWTGPLAHKLLFGVDYQRFREKSFIDQAFGTDINIYNPDYGNIVITPIGLTSKTNQLLNQTGLYVQDQVKLDRLILTLGVREDFSNIATQDLLGGPNSDQNENAFTQRYGINYMLDGGWSPYFSYATSFQPVLGTDLVTNAPFVPTTGEQYEVGIKYAPPGYNALFTLAAYNLTQQNVLTLDSSGFNRQLGEIRSRGIEFESKFNVTKNFDVIGSYTYVDADVTDDPDPARIGKHPVNIPDQTASLWGFYTFDEGSLDGFGLGGGVRYVGQSPGDDANSFFVSDYTLFDLAAQYDFAKLSPRLDGMSVRVNVINVGDLAYVSQCTNTVTCVYGNGRTILTTLKYQW